MSAIDIGPVHPWLLEPVKLFLEEENGTIVSADVTAGFVHRGVERLMQTTPYQKGLYISERICGICSSVHSSVFSTTLEKLMRIQTPPRANYIRTITLEIERLHSHFLWHGLLCHACGAGEAFLRTIAARETVMDLTEAVSGNRVNQSTNEVGGVRRDLGEREMTAFARALPGLKELAGSVQGDLSDGGVIAGKVSGVGMLERKEALNLGAVGPVLRGSGVASDVRSDDPYAAYKELGFRPYIEEGCDVLARARVRAGENIESIRLIEQALKDIPDGPLTINVPDPPVGEYAGRHEAPRGELFYFVRFDGSTVPSRVKIRAPTYANLPPLKKMLIGERLSNARYIIESIDLCLSCTDR